MTMLTVTAKGQVTLRKEVLQHMGIQPGDKIAIDMLPNGRLQLGAARPTGRISDVFGMLRREGQPVLSIDDINRTIEEGWAGER